MLHRRPVEPVALLFGGERIIAHIETGSGHDVKIERLHRAGLAVGMNEETAAANAR